MLDKNLQYLRKLHKLSQQELADTFSIPRSTLGDYERGKTEPNIEMLIRMSQYFDLSLDHLLQHKLYNDSHLLTKDDNLKILAITLDSQKKANIELVHTKAEAGYLESFQDPEYISELPKIQLPSLSEGTYRAFEISGDSMLPIESGSIIISKYIESISHIKDGRTYIIVSKSDGLVYKRVKNDSVAKRLILVSDNDLYLPYAIDYTDISEVDGWVCIFYCVEPPCRFSQVYPLSILVLGYIGLSSAIE
jgi:transcriptional regulator with XRE-family HTH domain